jgi:hypothetical protein
VSAGGAKRRKKDGKKDGGGSTGVSGGGEGGEGGEVGAVGEVGEIGSATAMDVEASTVATTITTTAAASSSSSSSSSFSAAAATTGIITNPPPLAHLPHLLPRLGGRLDAGLVNHCAAMATADDDVTDAAAGEELDSEITVYAALQILRALGTIAHRNGAEASPDGSTIGGGGLGGVGGGGGGGGGEGEGYLQLPSDVAAALAQQLVSVRLARKLEDQLEDALVVAAGCLPSWCPFLVWRFPFLFPLNLRLRFFESTAFGISNTLDRLQQRALRRLDASGVGGSASATGAMSRARQAILDRFTMGAASMPQRGQGYGT